GFGPVLAVLDALDPDQADARGKRQEQTKQEQQAEEQERQRLAEEQQRPQREAEERGRQQREQEKAERQRQADLAAQLEAALQAVAKAHAEARRLAEQQHDYAAAVQVLERVPEHLREGPLHASLRDKRDRVTQLDGEVRQAVRETRTAGLRPKVAAL